jgi:hypothetical protein
LKKRSHQVAGSLAVPGTQDPNTYPIYVSQLAATFAKDGVRTTQDLAIPSGAREPSALSKRRLSIRFSASVLMMFLDAFVQTE